MSKNLTRKSAALGAIVALGASLFAGTPALAAPSLTITPVTGTTFNVLATDTFKLKVTASTDFDKAEFANLNWQVTPSATITTTYNTGYQAPGTQADTGVTALTTSGVSRIVPPHTYTSVSTASANTLSIDPTTVDTTGTISYEVKAFIEQDATAGLSSGDTVVSSAVTVKFLKLADVSAAVEFSNVVVGSTPTAKVTLTPDINYSQLDVTASSYTTGADASVVGAFLFNGANETPNKFTTLAYDSTVGEWLTATAAAAITTAPAAGLQVYMKNYDTSGALKQVGTDFYGSATASTAVQLDSIDVANGATVKDNGGTYAAVVKNIKKGATSVTITGDANTKYGKAVVAGTPVSVSIAKTTLAAGSTVTAGGKTLTSASTSAIKFTVATDAAGSFSIPVSNSGAATNDDILVTISVGTADGTGSGPILEDGTKTGEKNTIRLVWIANAIDKVVELGAVESLASSNGVGHRAITKTEAVTLEYQVLDIFGAPYVNAADTSEYQIVVTPASSGSSPSTGAVTRALSAGKASITWTNDSSTTGEATLSAQLQSRVIATGGAYSAVAGKTASSVFDVVAAKVTPSTATISDAQTAQALSLVSYVAADRRGDANTTAEPASPTLVDLSGVITGSTGAPVAGAVVTVSAPGVAFKVGYVWAIGSVTVVSDEVGAYKVQTYSHTSGKITYTVSAGAATKTTTVTYDAPLATAGANVELTAPTQVDAGRTIIITAKVTDKYGNGVEVTSASTSRFKLSYVGDGYLTATEPTTTDSKGVATFRVLLGSGDKGAFTTTASYDKDGDETLYAAVTKTATIYVGIAAPSAAAKANVVAKTKAFSVSVSGNASAKNVVVKVAGKTVATLKGSASAKTYTVKATKGSKKVTVYVGGKLLLTKTVSVK